MHMKGLAVGRMAARAFLRLIFQVIVTCSDLFASAASMPVKIDCRDVLLYSARVSHLSLAMPQGFQVSPTGILVPEA
ncbi:hypothetical protein DPMN_181594 [Dreissena polymorpha]|uniref:Secreted protein n=1 Tax=Dreissena polymorpha TaxID=45954 RepID=A0A9D4I4J9_DREPO|nr:hypothetical protein DPMN_181594 [Dreissena polymorpha]